MPLPDRNLGDTGHVSDHDALHERYNNSVEVRSGLAAARPAAAAVPVGTLFWATDTLRLSRSDGTVWGELSAGASDHGALTGLGDDDHPQYALDADLASTVTALNTHDHVGGDGAQVDHGGLAGLGDDDHTQYLNLTRHAAVDAADHGSGSATAGQVLSADGSGGASWAAASTGPQGKMLWSPGPHPYRAGAWYSAWDVTANSVNGTVVTGEVWFSGPFYVSQSFNIDRIGFNAPTSGGNVRLALYAAAPDGRPGSLVVESADTTMVASSNALTVTSTALTANTFYFLASQFTAAASLSCYPSGSLPHAGFGQPGFGLNSAQTFTQSQVYGAFPATPTLAVSNFGAARPILWVRAV